MADDDNYNEIEKKATAEQSARSWANLRKKIDDAIEEVNRKNSSTTQTPSVDDDRKKSKLKFKSDNNDKKPSSIKNRVTEKEMDQLITKTDSLSASSNDSLQIIKTIKNNITVMEPTRKKKNEVHSRKIYKFLA